MEPQKSPIIGGFGTTRSQDAADNEAINLGVEFIETKDGKVRAFLFGLSGLDLLLPVGSGPIRGLCVLNDTLYVTSGNQVYSLDSLGGVALLGNVSIGTNLVSMFANTTQMMVLDGVGGWIAPGGLPLTNFYPPTSGPVPPTSSIFLGGSLYQVGDTINLQPARGTQAATPVVTVTQIGNDPVTEVLVPNTGAFYSNTQNAATAPIQPQPGNGTGLKLNITAVSGNITVAAVNTGGTNYHVGDTGLIGTGSAVYQVTTVSGTAVTGVRLLFRGAGEYTSASGVAVTPGPGITVNAGLGLSLDLVVIAGQISQWDVNNGGTGYQVGNAGTITGGGGSGGTYYVVAVGPQGVVLAFQIFTPGAIATPAASYTQKSTDGSGSGFELLAPTYGSFIGLVPIVLPFPNPIKGGVSDGFGVMVFTGSQNIAASDELDLSVWNPLSFGVADQTGDTCIGLEVFHDQIYVFKQLNTEVWADEGLTPFPFAPLTGVHIEYGEAAPFSSAVADNDLIWLQRNKEGAGTFVRTSGYVPVPCSSQAVANEIQQYANLSDCIAYVRQEGGHTYYVATFPEAGVTWCYDKTTSDLTGQPVWTKMAALDEGEIQRHWGNCFTPWAGIIGATINTVSFQAIGVEITKTLETATGLTGFPTSFSTAVFSVWSLSPDDPDFTGFVFGNQTSVTPPNPGLQITIQNDQTGTPEITVEAWDGSSNPIVSATYDWVNWTEWNNFLISIDTTTNMLQVYASTTISGVFSETLLTPAAITWHSTSAIGAPTGDAWEVSVI